MCIGLVVSRCGMPPGYEFFAGNTADVTTVEHIVETMEKRYGNSDRIRVMDRGMVSEENIDSPLSGNRRYIVGTPKSMLRTCEAELLGEDGHAIRDGLEVKLCRRPREESDETDSTHTDEDLGKACMQLTEAEAAFRIHKSDLSIRPIWHQKVERVLAHIFVCFLAAAKERAIQERMMEP